MSSHLPPQPGAGPTAPPPMPALPPPPLPGTPPYAPKSGAVPAAAMRNALRIALVMTALYASQVFIDMLRPRYEGEEAHAWVGILNPPLSGMPDPGFGWYKVSFWVYVIALPVAAAIWLFGSRHARTLPDPAASARATLLWQGWVIGVLLAPYPLWTMDGISRIPGYILICLPSTAYAVWLVHRMQRFARVPGWLLLSMVGWGALIGVGFGGSMIQWWMDYSGNFLFPEFGPDVALDFGRFRAQQTSGALLFAGIFEELGKGLGVAFAYLLLRRHIHNVVSGIVLGAASGAGFNLMESANYMAIREGSKASSEYFTRQSLGLMAGHLAFTAAIGAGFGIARKLKDPAARRRAIVCGFGIAMAGHFSNNAFFSYYGRHKQDWFSPTDTVDTLVLLPLAMFLFQGPLVLLYVILVRRGNKDQAAALAVELRAEAATGFGAVTAAEVPVLLRPGRRLFLRLRALRRDGLTGYRDLSRLYAAQLRLGAARWDRARDEYVAATDASVPATPEEQTLREQIMRLKGRQAQQAAPARPLQVAP
ncbi:PrsW family intramembrane metalloprotease [Streptomyces sp. NBC_01304]|uniref:PrsW family intramembrane metalloprotease n=1 Tax=Streptomyces sp. NBC_01304 TaxID=2903818 RepID=UPI002E0EA881|nr:PrsW family intramembrane metalloprotease [Streptomyces sp. NBC_01304]